MKICSVRFQGGQQAVAIFFGPLCALVGQDDAFIEFSELYGCD